MSEINEDIMKDILLNMSINAMKDNFLVLDDDMKQKEFCKLLDENQQLKQQLEEEKNIRNKAIGHIIACDKELSKDECIYLLQILQNKE